MNFHISSLESHLKIMAALGAVQAGAIAGRIAAGTGYYAAMQEKKKNEYVLKACEHNMSPDAYLAMIDHMKRRKLERKASKYGMTLEEYEEKRAKDFDTKMMSRYGAFTGSLPEALLAAKNHFKGRKRKKKKGHSYSGRCSKNSSRCSSGSRCSSRGAGSSSDSDDSDCYEAVP